MYWKHVNPLNAQLNPICHLLALLGAHPILHASRIRVNTRPSYCVSVVVVYKIWWAQVGTLTDFATLIRHNTTKRWGRDSSVGIATGYGLDGPGIESRWVRDLSHTSRPALGPTQPPTQ
jgi:hypothetical protein